MVCNWDTIAARFPGLGSHIINKGFLYNILRP